MNRALFFDRDGTISEEVGYVNHIDRFRVYPWSAEAVRLGNEAGWKVIVVTNQSGVARGYFPCSLVDRIHQDLRQTLHRNGAVLDGIYFCPHHPDGVTREYSVTCDCRKPQPGMLLQAAQDHQIDLESSWVVGDRHVETLAAHAVGAKSVLVMTGYGRGEYEYMSARWSRPPDHLADNLLQATEWILNHAG